MEINGKVKVSGEYFLKMAKADYRNYRQALWREIYQNSIDAGSSEIQVSFNKEERSITVTDNGCGMSLEILTEKLLALGGTHKAEGSTGAFGKAKELELFAHKKYIVHTHNLLLVGSGDNYTITETEDYFDGTSITIYIQEEEDFGYLCDRAKNVAQKIETSTTIYVEGNLIECAYPKGEFRKTLEVGDIYVNEDLHTSSYTQVRMNGIWMFEHYVGPELPYITLELSSDSIQAMTSNRDGLKDDSLRSANEFFHKLAADRKSSLFPDKELITLKARGTDGEKIQVTDDDISFMERRASATNEQFLEALAKFYAVNSMDTDEKLARMRLTAEDVDRYDYTQLKFFGFRWDTIHKFEKGQEKQAHDFLDGSTAKARKAKTLLTMWGETIKQIMIDNRWYHQFTIGFCWDENQAASLEKKGMELFFYLNPSILEKYSLMNKKLLVRKLRQLASHEVTHLNNEYHDEYFTNNRDGVDENTWKSDRMYDQIAKIKV